MEIKSTSDLYKAGFSSRLITILQTIGKPINEITYYNLLLARNCGEKTRCEFFRVTQENNITINEETLTKLKIDNRNSKETHLLVACVNGYQISLDQIKFFCKKCDQEFNVSMWRKHIGKDYGCM